MDELNQKNGNNVNNANGNGNSSANGNGNGNGNNHRNGNDRRNGSHNLESIIEDDSFKGKIKEFIISTNRKLVPYTDHRMLHLEKENKKLRRMTLNANKRITPKDMTVESQIDAYLQEITIEGIDSSETVKSGKVIEVKEDKNISKYEIISAKEIDENKNLTSEIEKYTKYVDFASNKLSSAVAIYKKPFEIVSRKKETKLNEFLKFEEVGDVIRTRTTLHHRIESGMVKSYADDLNKEDYRKYETPVFDEKKNLIAIIAIKENPIKLSDEDWNFNIFNIEHSKEHLATMLKNAENYEETVREAEKAKREAKTDELTGLKNGRGLKEEAVKHSDIAMSLYKGGGGKKEDKYLNALVMIDLNSFKEVNDKYGHLIGDMVLKEVANTMKESHYPDKEGVDVLARPGGDEFIMFYPGTSAEQAMIPAERFVKNLFKRKIKVGENEYIGITGSIGICDSWSGIEIIKRKIADEKFKEENPTLYDKFCQFREKQEAWVNIKDKDVEQSIKDISRKNFFHSNNIYILYEAMFYGADTAVYDVKRNGKNGISIFNIERNYNLKPLHSLEDMDKK